MKLSIVSTLYYSRIFLDEFLKEVICSINEIGINDFELIFVNDGSPDDSVEYLLKRKDGIPEIVVVDLTRNFGHHNAIKAGLTYASGDLVFLIDNDLEISPRFLIECFNKMKSDDDISVVYGVQKQRKGKFFESFGGKVFWKIFNVLSDVEIKENIVTERLMKKKYVDMLLELGDANLFMAGMMQWVGERQEYLLVEKKERTGKSTYSIRKRLELMTDAITSFSGKPLRYLFYFGNTIMFISFIFIVYLLIKKMILQDQVKLGWTSIIVTIVFVLGVLSSFMGIIGIYIAKIYRQVQGRPNYLIKKIHK